MSEEPGTWILAVTLLGGGGLLIVIGRKQAAGTLRRNWIAGLRTWETMRSDEAWHAAHSATSGSITAAGVVLVLAGAALVVLRPAEGVTTAIALGAGGFTLLLVLTAGVRGHRIAARVNRDQGGGHLPWS